MLSANNIPSTKRVYHTILRVAATASNSTSSSTSVTSPDGLLPDLLFTVRKHDMFDITNPHAQDALSSVSDLLSRSSTPVSEYPSPLPRSTLERAASLRPAKRLMPASPDKKVDFGQKLAKRKSQEFAAKIAQWNQAGGGIAQPEEQRQDEVVVVVEEEVPVRKEVKEVKKVKEVNKAKVPKNEDPAPAPVVTKIESEISTAGKSQTDGHKSDSVTMSPVKPKTPVQDADNLATSRRPAKAVDLDRKAWVRRKSRPQIELEDVKHAGQPKKRVISDGHWRKDRLAKAESPEKDATPKPITVKRSVVSVGLKVPPSIGTFIEEPEPEPYRSRPLRSPRSRSKSRERENTPDYEDSGLKVYIKQRRRSRDLGSELKAKDLRSSASSSYTGGSSVDKRTSSTSLTTPDLSPVKKTPPRPSTAPKERPSRKSLPKDDATPTSKSDGKTNPSISKKKPSPRSEPKVAVAPAVPKVFGTRIEGWLADTSDPFIEPSLAPKPLSIHRKKSRANTDEKDSDYGSQTDDGHRKSSARRRRSRPSLEHPDTETTQSRRTSHRSSQSPVEDREVPVSATPTLKRRGARKTTHSPVKERSSRDSFQTLDEVVVIEEDGSSVSMEKERAPRASSKTMGARGHRLSTVASDETLTRGGYQHEGSIISRASDGETTRRGGTIKRRLTKHSDLISVLSLPQADTRSIVSARSIRTQRAKPENATAGSIMNEVTTDELKYQRELRTLVDGVIPVLLQHVLKADSSAPGLFNRSGRDDQAVTQPIVDMGVALERLKSIHKRIPMHEPNDLVTWARAAEKVYSDYLQVWRLGFQDIVVNLAPAEGAEKLDSSSPGVSVDVVGGDGERQDVAFLLKRPLVRLKYLANAFKNINQIQPSPSAEDMAARYNNLVQEAKKRSNDERARLEDEAAASIDPTRTRDPRSLAPLTGVRIDPTRCVKARDYFDLDLRHSSGQQLTCKIEMIMRDDAPGRGNSGDILFCEISTTGRWLLFPPVLASLVSARTGGKEGEIVLMVRGMLASGREWREIMSLQSDDEGAVEDWLDMLSATPVPSALFKKSSFDIRQKPVMSGALATPAPDRSRAPSPSEVEVPIGERASAAAKMWDGSDVNSVIDDLPSPGPTLRRSKATRYRHSQQSPVARQSSKDDEETYAWERPQNIDRPRSEYFGQAPKRPSSSYTRSSTEWTGSTLSSSKKDYSVWLPSESQLSEEDDEDSADESDRPPRRPSMHRRMSSVPSLDMPNINKLRKEPSATPQPRSSGHRRAESTPVLEPASAPARLHKRASRVEEPQKAPHPPTHNPRPTSLGLRSGVLPSFTPNFLKRHRRSSSPLKHEYEPSTATESTSSESELSDLDEEDSLTSESEPDEQVSTVGELKSFPTYGGYKPMKQPSPPESLFSPSGASVSPSQSASQGPFRKVPQSTGKVTEAMASIFSWAESGSWDSLHPQECRIVVTPGLIEAFDLAQAHAAPVNSPEDAQLSPSQRGVKPLVALELTPLVPLRRGTALDISVRSPPTPNSVYRVGNNVMFRSSNPEECEALYHLINWARINNPTYIALQKARGPYQEGSWGEAMERRNSQRNTSGSWFNLGSRKGSTYRSNGTRPVSHAATDSSIGTMNTAFSALRRFSNGSRFFNIAKSTISTREGTRSTYSDSLSSGAATPLPVDPSLGTPLGLTNMKIRLYYRETASKWRDMGSARMTIMLPHRSDPSIPANPRTTGKEKRIIIQGKTQGETLVDATLGESCFERVARTGIAVSVWEETMGPNGEIGHVGAVGGVVGARAKVYMVQMKSERDTAYTFGLVGKLRY